MTADSSSAKTFGRIMHLPMPDLRDYPELHTRAIETAEEAIQAEADAEGYELTGALTVHTYYGKRVREDHHDHGWQMTLVHCVQEEATVAIVMIEMLGVR